MRTLALCARFALLALPAAGLEPYLVKDIRPVASAIGSHPDHLVTFRHAVLFFADDGLSGRQLWRSDGTAAGTFQLSDAAPGELPDPMPFFVAERLCFFLSAHPLTGVPALWVSDGTPAGTFRLTGEGVAVDGLQRLFAASQGLLYFTARDPEHGAEPWVSDGTPAGNPVVPQVPKGRSIGPGRSAREPTTLLRGSRPWPCLRPFGASGKWGAPNLGLKPIPLHTSWP